MKITSIHTPVIRAGAVPLIKLLDTALAEFDDGSILVITSKIVSLCESNVAEIEPGRKDQLIRQESEYYLESQHSTHGYHFSIVNGALTSSAGIDESNADGKYVLWPRHAQQTANEIRAYLMERFTATNVGVMIVDSTSLPLRRGAIGTCLVHSGFKALNDYRGTLDLFGRPIRVEVANVREGLAAAAVAVMGEGAEGTPLARISEANFVTFQAADPTPEELAELHIALDDDYFSSFLLSAPWQRGDRT